MTFLHATNYLFPPYPPQGARAMMLQAAEHRVHWRPSPSLGMVAPGPPPRRLTEALWRPSRTVLAAQRRHLQRQRAHARLVAMGRPLVHILRRPHHAYLPAQHKIEPQRRPTTMAITVRPTLAPARRTTAVRVIRRVPTSLRQVLRSFYRSGMPALQTRLQTWATLPCHRAHQPLSQSLRCRLSYQTRGLTPRVGSASS